MVDLAKTVFKIPQIILSFLSSLEISLGYSLYCRHVLNIGMRDGTTFTTRFQSFRELYLLYQEEWFEKCPDLLRMPDPDSTLTCSRH